MSTPTREELLERFAPVNDPEIMARRQHILDVLLEQSPQTKQQLTERAVSETRLTEVRSALRQVLLGRQLTPSRDDDARIEACTDYATLRRWHSQAITAVSTSDALE